MHRMSTAATTLSGSTDHGALSLIEQVRSALAQHASSPRFDDVFRTIGDALRSALRAEQVSIWVIDPLAADPLGSSESGVAQPAYATLPDEIAAQLPAAAALAGTDLGAAFREGRPRITPAFDLGAIRLDSGLPKEREPKLWIVPIRPAALRLDAPEANPQNVIAAATLTFSADEPAAMLATELIGHIGTLCGEAIERALWREQEHIIAKVYEVLDHVDSDRYNAMGAVASAIRDATGFEACTILQAEDSRRVLHVLGTTGIESNVPLRKMHYPYGFSCSGWVADHKRTLALEDFAASDRHQGPMYPDAVETADRRQYLGTPLLSARGELLGVVRLRNKRPPPGRGWPTSLTHLDERRLERAARVIAPLIALMIRERQQSATMERIRHDIDMPATAIRDGAGMLLREADATFQHDLPRVRQRLEDMESFAEILLVNSELMGMSRVGDIPFRPENVLPLAGFVAKLCKMLTPAARRRGLSGILYNQGSFFSIPSLWLDPRLFQIAMYNLLQNAIKYSHPSTVITVEGESARLDGETWYCIDVKNTGIGVTDDELPRIFERSYRSRRARKRSETGLGIGLSTAKELIERHGGRLVLTRQNNPTVFSIQLPASLATRKPE